MNPAGTQELKFGEEELLPGTRFKTYRGSGKLLVTANGEAIEQPCEFLCAQMSDGRLLCHCFWTGKPLDSWELFYVMSRKPVFHLFGTCEADDLAFSAHCLTWTEYKGGMVSFIAGQIHVGQDAIEQAHSIRFYLVNLTLDTAIELPPHNGLTIRLQPRQDYDRVLALVKATRGVQVTAEALVSSPNGGTDLLVNAANVMDEGLGVLLSLARANLVHWIAFEALDAKGHPLAWRHRGTVTKPFSPYDFIEPVDTESFLSQTLPQLSTVDACWRFRDAVLSLVDATTGADFLEARGLKAAVILDFLCARFREVAGEEYLLPTSFFRAWARHLRSTIGALTCELLDRTSQISRTRITQQWHRLRADDDDKGGLLDEIEEHVPEFNRYTFRTSLRRLLHHLKLVVDEHDITDVIKIRNTLVHEMHFPSRQSGTDAMLTDYHLLLRCIAQILLALVKYDGHFTDWTRLGSVEEREHELRIPMRYVADARATNGLHPNDAVT